LGNTVVAGAGERKLPQMLGKVKTPDRPLHLAGDTRRDGLTWNIVAAKEGLVAKGVDAENQLRAFVVSEDKMKEAFALLKQLVS
ncbi:FAD-dependent oxidoreductase, partial [Staphylococcus aureus]|nr:FAD-dependent oxidoreductase [Staphylococcus aureus]